MKLTLDQRFYFMDQAIKELTASCRQRPLISRDEVLKAVNGMRDHLYAIQTEVFAQEERLKQSQQGG